MAAATTCKTIHFVRHAEGTHNRDSREIPGFHEHGSRTMAYWDAPLTTRGIDQGHKLSLDVMNLAEPPDVVVVSPLRRAIHTAQLGFRPEEAGGKALPFVATELCRERISYHTCDGRRDLSEIKQEFGFVDFTEVGDDYFEKIGEGA